MVGIFMSFLDLFEIRREKKMLEIPPEMAKNAVSAFLKSQFDKKTEKEHKQLEKARIEENHSKVAELQEKIAEVNAKFQADVWLADACNRMAKQLKFGTHISKGVHPDAKGDNISFVVKTDLPLHIVGTHSIDSDYIDANGNAAALPLASFFDFELSDADMSNDTESATDTSEQSLKIRDLILQDNTDFIRSLASDEQTATGYHHTFKTVLQNTVTQPVTHERNKQTLWANNAYSANTLDDLSYTTVIPLYPSVLTHKVYQRVNQLRYSDENKTARDNRFKKTAEQKTYVSMLDLATVQLGGTKPQNVSLLMSKQGGRNYLLPSLPPVIEWSYSFNLSKFSDSIFKSKSLVYHSQNAIQRIFNSVKVRKNTVDYRYDRKDAIDSVLHILFSIANDIRTNQPAGWSRDYDLDMEEKLWLDPMRAEMPDEYEFREKRETEEWDKVIVTRFANWLNKLLKDEFKGIKHEFAKPEHDEWQNEIEDMKKRYERAGKGVFL